MIHSQDGMNSQDSLVKMVKMEVGKISLCLMDLTEQ